MTTVLKMRAEASPEEIAVTRFMLLQGVDARMGWERANNTAPDSILETLATFRKSIENCDAFTLAGARHFGITAEFFTSQIVRDICRNVYALRKILAACRVWQGSAFVPAGDDATTAGTIIGISEGHTGKALANRVDVLCSALGMGRVPGVYTSGATQSGSSVAALQSLGILATRHGAREIVNQEAWGVLRNAARAMFRKHAPDALRGNAE